MVSIAYRNEPYGEGLAKNFSAAWQAKGGKVQGPVVYDPNRRPFDSEAGQIVANNPDAYVIYRLPRHLREDGRLAGAHRQVRRHQAVRSRRAVLRRRCRAAIPPQALEGARGNQRRHAAAEPMPPSCSTSCGRRPAAWSISPSMPTASIPTTLCFLAAAAAKSNDPGAITANPQRHVAGCAAIHAGPRWPTR